MPTGGENPSADEVDAAEQQIAYLREAIGCFGSYIDLFDFLLPECKPTGTTS